MKTLDPMRNLVSFVDRRQLLTAQIDAMLSEVFMPGTYVRWTIGQGTCTGVVITACWERVKVKNSVSGKEYWVNLPRFIEAWKGWRGI